MSGNGPTGAATPASPPPPAAPAPAAPAPAAPAPAAPAPAAPAAPPRAASPAAAPAPARPAAGPGTPAAPAATGAAGGAATAPGASAGGSGALLTFAMKAIEQTERKTLVFEYHRQQAVTRQYAPQSLIGLMLDDMTGPGHFIEVDLDDAFFRSLDVEVSLTTGFEAIGLQSVAVALDYGDADHPQKHRHADLVFDATRTAPQHWVVPIGSDYDLGYTPRIEYHFDPAAGWDAESNEVVVEPGRIEDRTLQLDPTQHVGLLQVEVRPDGLDPEEVRSVELVLTHTAPSGWVAKRTFPVTPASAPQTWKLRTSRRDAARQDPIDYAVAMTYTLVEGDPLTLPVATSSATTVVVGSPFADHLERRIDFSIPPGRFTSVVLDVTYDDGSHKTARRVELAGDALTPTLVRLGILDPTKRDTTTQATLLGAAGEVVRGAPFTGAAEFLSVAEDGTVTGA